MFVKRNCLSRQFLLLFFCLLMIAGTVFAQSSLEETFAKGNAFANQGNYDEAIVEYSKILEVDPKNIEAYGVRGFLYIQKGDFDQAIADYNSLLEIEPNSVRAYMRRGSAYLEKGDLDKAMVDFNQVIEKDPDVPSYAQRGLIYYQKGDFDLAIADFTKALEMDPESVYVDNARMSAYAKKLGFDKALAEYVKGIDRTPDGEIIVKYIGDYSKSIGQKYSYLSMLFGIRGKEWDLLRQSLKEKDGKTYDQMDIKLLPSGEERVLYFNITEPFSYLK